MRLTHPIMRWANSMFSQGCGEVACSKVQAAQRLMGHETSGLMEGKKCSRGASLRGQGTPAFILTASAVSESGML